MATKRRAAEITDAMDDTLGEVAFRAQEAANSGTFDRLQMARVAMARINREFEKQKKPQAAIHTADQLPAVDRLQTGWITFDVITGGGFPKRRATQIKGPNHLGKTTVILDAIALQQTVGEIPIWVQGEEYDKEWATQRGVDNERVIIVPTTDATLMLETTCELMAAGFSSMVAIDSIQAIKSKRALDTPIGETGFGSGAPQLWGDFYGKVLSMYSEGLSDAAIIWVSQMRAVIAKGWTPPGAETADGTQINTLMHWKSIDVRFRPGSFIKVDKSEKEPCGRTIVLKNEKNKVGPTPYMTGEIRHVYFDEPELNLKAGTDRGWEVAAWAEYFGVVEHKGTRFYLPNDKDTYGALAGMMVANGLDNFKEFCRVSNGDENATLAVDALVNRIYEEAVKPRG